MSPEDDFAAARKAAGEGRYSYVEQLLFGPGAERDSVLGYGFDFNPGQQEALARLVRLANESLESLTPGEVKK